MNEVEVSNNEGDSWVITELPGSDESFHTLYLTQLYDDEPVVANSTSLGLDDAQLQLLIDVLCLYRDEATNQNQGTESNNGIHDFK